MRALILTILLAACSNSDDRTLRVGDEPPGSRAGAGAGTGSFGNAGGPRSGSGGDAADAGSVKGEPAGLRVRVQNPEAMTIDVLTLNCAGDCADVQAVANGGNPPYAFAWEDGSTSPTRHVCLDDSTTLSISATDTAIHDDEFSYEAQTATAEVTANVLDCTAIADAGTCGEDAAATALEQLAPDIFGTPAYFSNGDSLPAGKYRIIYVDGCMKYDASWAWTVQGSGPTFLGPEFQFQWVLIGASTTDVLGLLPGTEASIGSGATGYANYDDCVAANRALPPLDFDFAGGKLGIWQDDFQPTDNMAGEKSPTWQLSRLDCH